MRSELSSRFLGSSIDSRPLRSSISIDSGFCRITERAAPLRIFLLDVGQGDSTLIVTPKGGAVLIDGGRAASGRLVAGLHRARSPELVAIHECPASDPLAWDLVEHTVALLNRLPHRAWDPWFAPKALLRSVLVRTTTDGQAHVVIVATGPDVPGLDDLLDDLHRAGASSISVNHNDGDPAVLLGRNTRLLSGRP